MPLFCKVPLDADVPSSELELLGAPRPLHFLHIGKAAGTQVGLLAEEVNAAQKRWAIVKHRHRTNLCDLPKGEAYFFSIRDPLTRFYSGFYSRKRKGQPRIYSEWTKDEKKAFSIFENANDLAEALFADGHRGAQAMAAINAIRHTGKAQVDWFSLRGFFLTRRPPVWILRQEQFAHDWTNFCHRIGVSNAPTPATDSERAHRNDYSVAPPLSDKARENLTRWYTQDIEFYRRCEAWIARQEQKLAAESKEA